MKFVIFLGILALAVLSQAESFGLEETITPAVSLQEVAVPVYRPKRATCDLLSVWNVNHSACAVHCIARRFKGGYCNGKAVCVCRH